MAHLKKVCLTSCLTGLDLTKQVKLPNANKKQEVIRTVSDTF